jgi:D-alanine-D-alanine ligase
MIIGREFSCGIVAGKALPIIEIIPKVGFYDYKNKYQKGLTTEICPAEIDITIGKKIQEFSLQMHKVLRLGYYSRSDFIVQENGEIVYLETNTLPGMTPTSLLPQEAKVCGITYNELCDQIVHNPII